MNTTQRLLLTSVGPILALLFLSGMTFLNQQDLNRSQTNRHESLKLSRELRASSDELTRLARTYVLTGDAEYERQFWAVLNARDGQQARPDGRTVALRVLMQQQGFTANEFAKLKEAEDSSNALVNTETIAMHAIKGEFDDGRGGFTRQGPPDAETARRIMHDKKYHDDKEIIMRPIGVFESMLDSRTEAATVRYRRWGDILHLLGLVLAVCAAVTAWLGIRRHAASLRHAIAELSLSSQHVASTATEVASASLFLAEGATKQVASLEDIAGSAREMSAGASDNVRRTDAASELVSREQQEFAGAMPLLVDLVKAIEEIDASSGQISKINKLVDEIAFQTNILALNAAVEAARAGEAGLGFAVVADEVRRLAKRCAAAAGESTSLIEESIARTRLGQEKMTHVTDSIRRLAGLDAEVRGLMDQVRDGSRTQHAAVARIGTAIGQIEQVTHRAAAGAEEGSVAAKEMNVQASRLRHVVADLQAMVD